ncbi:MAG TPA: lactate racemase domain-containing protein [Bacteroidales bacterium]|nr:lactate racemase domain-containing protein [Bacteroidales bacterium]HOK97523.1 lactate racemase domain-containing protein [Bacteroidales bacterium]HPO64343.1 lactate racemase domain-containing protein [Bacteroidales bacterium]
MIYFERGSETDEISLQEARQALFSVFEKLGTRRKVMIIPPDSTRRHSMAGELTSLVYEYYRDRISDILPALGTHAPMTASEIANMFKNIPANLFRIHDWRNDVVELGRVSADFIRTISEGRVSYDWPVQVNRLIHSGNHDLIVSVGQVVPHEVTGMANYNKNILVGTGGSEAINKSHFLGAAYGMERIMGRSQNPVRKLLNYAEEKYLAHLPMLYVLTVMGQTNDQRLVLRGLFIGYGTEVFEKAAALSLKVNFQMLESPLKKIVVYLPEDEYKSTWLGNKSIYRTRMVLADEGELIVLAPAVNRFGEDPKIDQLIRKFGYKGTTAILKAVEQNVELQQNLGAAAHLIHGSSDGRFRITYCPKFLSEEEIENVGFDYAPYDEMIKKYPPNLLKEGMNMVNGEEVYFISNPALGLWAWKDKFVENASASRTN